MLKKKIKACSETWKYQPCSIFFHYFCKPYTWTLANSTKHAWDPYTEPTSACTITLHEGYLASRAGGINAKQSHQDKWRNQWKAVSRNLDWRDHVDWRCSNLTNLTGGTRVDGWMMDELIAWGISPVGLTEPFRCFTPSPMVEPWDRKSVV